jgi:AraC-like DNA-binding protein
MKASAIPHPLFSPAAMAVLQRPDRWRFIGARFSADAQATRNPPDATWRRRHTHCHSGRELLWVLKGRTCQGLAGNVYAARPGDVFVFDPMEPHDVGYPGGAGPAEHLWLSVLHDRCAAMMIHVGGGRGGHVTKWRRLLAMEEMGLTSGEALFRGEDNAIGQGSATVRLRYVAAATFLAAAVVESGFRQPAMDRDRDTQRDVILTIRRHIEAARGKGCGLDSLAHIAGYSKYHFLRIFHRHVGMTLHSYVDQCRRQAYGRLAAEGLRQKVISHTLGFSHPSALTRWRKRMRVG